MRRFLVAIVAFIWSVSAIADEFKHGTPESAGMSSERLERVTDVMQSYIDRGYVPGIHVLVARRGVIVYDNAIGTRGKDDDRPLEKDALYRIYSMTKPITAVAAMQLYEQGKFKLDSPVAEFISEFGELKVHAGDEEPVPVNRPMNMRHLLTHTAGLGYGLGNRHPVDRLFRQNRVLGSTDLDEMIGKMKEIPLKFQPGDRWDYSAAVDVTGLVVQRLSGQSFNEYLEEHIFAPLRMDDTFFEIPEDKHDRLLPVHNWSRQESGAIVMRPNQPTDYRNVTMFSGGGGLISTGMDYLRFAEALRRGGELEGSRIIGRKTIEYMTQNHLPATLPGAGTGDNPTAAATRAQQSSFGFGLGFGINTNPMADGNLSSRGEFNWGGAAGTVFWVDPEEELVVVGLIQLMGGGILRLGTNLKVAVLQAITD
ncbi:MAG: serine hydrolase [Gammaproteobacteria bacterium]|nr:serine hydrolase [Gammaproteobacteria bacterium]